MAQSNPLVGTEILQVLPLDSQGRPAAVFEQVTTGQIAGLTGYETFGSGTAVIQAQGNIYRLFSGGTNPTATSGDIVVATYTIPANSFDIAGRLVTISAAGNFANNGNAKTCKIVFNPTTFTVGSAVVGGTTLATTGSNTTSGGIGWCLCANVGKYGAAGSNTQMYQEMAVITGTTHDGMGVAGTLTATESSAIPIAVTINVGTATDASLWQVEVNANN